MSTSSNTHDAQSNGDSHPVDNLLSTERAARFAQRMIETWPTGPRRNIWYEIANQCHDTQALKQAYRDLERTTHHISTAHFWAAYNAAKRKATLTEEPDKCGLCDDTGWVNDEHYHSRLCKRDGTCHCHGVKPCRCTFGQQMIQTQRRIHEANRTAGWR